MNRSKTHKAVTCEWREKVMNKLNLEYTILNNQIVYKGSIGEYKTLVGLLVNEAIKNNIKTY